MVHDDVRFSALSLFWAGSLSFASLLVGSNGALREAAGGFSEVFGRSAELAPVR